MPRQPERILLLRSGRHVQVAVDALKRESPDCAVTIVSMPPGHFFSPLPFLFSADGARAWRGGFSRVCVLWNDPNGAGQSNVDHTALCLSPLGFTAITADGTLIPRRTTANVTRELGRAAISMGVAVLLGVFLYLPALILGSSEMIRILHVIESLAAGGIETTFLNMLRSWREEALASSGPWAQHHVLAFAGGSLEAEYQNAADAVTITASQQELERIVLGHHDVIYFTFERCAYRLLPVIVSHSRAAVVYGKGYDMGGMFRLNDGLEWQADESMMWGADAVTFTTDQLASGFILDGPKGPSLHTVRATVLGKAADVHRLMSIAPPDVSTPRRIVCVANLHARKRLGDLVTAVARLKPDFRDICVRFVGADESGEGARLREQGARLGIADACEFVGRRADVATDLELSRIFALPSGCEGVPTAMLEAMAAARPVVMTDVGHISSAVTDGVEGYVVAPGDVDALTARLRTLLAEPATAQRMGLAARARAERHDVAAVAARLRTVLELAATRKAA